MKNIHRVNENIYITNDEEIKESDWVIEINTSPRTSYIGKTFYPKNDGTVTEEDLKKYLLSVNYKDHYETIAHKGNCEKIILTTDQDLIADGVQAIDDEFLEWFVKNPSCEWVEVEKMFNVVQFTSREFIYKIIIPKEEPKQETLEEDLHQLFKNNFDCYADVDSDNVIMAMTEDCFIETFKEWQQQQNKNLYSEGEVEYLLYSFKNYLGFGEEVNEKKWFEQFKKQ